MNPSPWFVKFAARPDAAVRLLCCPFAGGGASVFADWSKALDPRLELIAVQLPGRESRLREPPCRSMSDVVAGLMQDLPKLLDRPYIVCGHSMGANVGFEIAHALLASGFPPPLHLFVLGAPAPHLPKRSPAMSHLPDVQFIEELRRYGGMPHSVIENSELMELCLPILRADFKLIEHYRSGPRRPYLPVPTSVYGGEEDATINTADLHAWRESAQVVKVGMQGGGHFFVKTHYGRILDDIAAVARAHRFSHSRSMSEPKVKASNAL